jgi:hypothetical protein
LGKPEPARIAPAGDISRSMMRVSVGSGALASASSGNGFVLLTHREGGMPLAASLAGSIIPAKHGVFRFHLLG